MANEQVIPTCTDKEMSLYSGYSSLKIWEARDGFQY